MKENENQEPSSMAGAAKGGNTSKEIVGSAVSAAAGEPVATDDLPLLPARPKSMMGQTLGYSDDDMREYALTAIAARLAAPTQVSAPQADEGSQLYSWLVKVSKCGLPNAEHAAEVLKAYYEGYDYPASAAQEVRAVPVPRDTLLMIYEAMNYMGDILNGVDACEAEYEDATTPAFEALRQLLDDSHGAPASTSGAPAASQEGAEK